MSPERPLRGRTVLVTRGVGKGDRLGELLEAMGAAVVRVPLIETRLLSGAASLAGAVVRLADGEGQPWLVLTSETAVQVLLDDLGDAATLDGIAVAVVGPVTEAALRDRGVAPALVASGQTAESLASELVGRGMGGARALVVAAAGGREVVSRALRAAGAGVEVIEAYQSVLPEGAIDRLLVALTATPPDAVTFTSGSTVANFSVGIRGKAPPPCTALCIGPVTSRAARRAGWAAVVTAGEHTAQGLVEAAVQTLRAQALP
ncbi:MAG: uroporphyrinogen-III synthase [Candidatus Dormibacteraeota bacterium]|uniref:Uroporphyrinogen-III synthase n=1 Tax=Candidatus Amunia macphersoniae TaxID=3127014 RepID=A0A934KE18_9BACT|nr:uroporphyrinogen-III synthase [Candidatus Dormibacteraeota bacterium]